MRDAETSTFSTGAAGSCALALAVMAANMAAIEPPSISFLPRLSIKNPPDLILVCVEMLPPEPIWYGLHAIWPQGTWPRQAVPGHHPYPDELFHGIYEISLERLCRAA